MYKAVVICITGEAAVVGEKAVHLLLVGTRDGTALLIRSLLAFSRKQVQSLQLLDLNPVLQDLGRMLPRLIGEDIQLALIPGKSPGKVKADPVQIEQVDMNLATNARDAMLQGGRLNLETSNVERDEAYVGQHPILPPGSYVLLTLTDSVGGILPEHLPHIFEPFYTTQEKGKGTGLGLATVYGIVKQSGGYVWVYSEPGLGTPFKIYLPRVGAAAARSIPADRFVDSPRATKLCWWWKVRKPSALKMRIPKALRLSRAGGSGRIRCAPRGARIRRRNPPDDHRRGDAPDERKGSRVPDPQGAPRDQGAFRFRICQSPRCSSTESAMCKATFYRSPSR